MASPDLKIEITASAIAWYGALVATASIIISLYNIFRDRARVKIKFQKGLQIFGQQTIYDPSKTYFNITVINKGRRPIKITKAAVRTVGQGMKYALLADSFIQNKVRVLTEENPSTDFMMEQDEDILSIVWYISIHDATGRIYRKFIRIFPPNLNHWWKQITRKPGSEARQ